MTWNLRSCFDLRWSLRTRGLLTHFWAGTSGPRQCRFITFSLNTRSSLTAPLTTCQDFPLVNPPATQPPFPPIPTLPAGSVGNYACWWDVGRWKLARSSGGHTAWHWQLFHISRPTMRWHQWVTGITAGWDSRARSFSAKTFSFRRPQAIGECRKSRNRRVAHKLWIVSSID